MFLIEFYRTTVGKKILMALSGVILFLFVIGHMGGNLKMFFGVDPVLHIYRIDHYGRLLRTIGADFLGGMTTLWLVRIVLLGSVIIHIVTGTQLWLLNRAARAVKYECIEYDSATVSSRTMFYGGAFMGLFVVYHILQFTTGQAYPGVFEHGQVYSNLYFAFQHGYLAVLYVISMLLLALHLWHGGWSLFQTLGLDTPRINSGLGLFAKIMAVLLFVGFASVPTAVYFHLLPPPVAEVQAGEGGK